MGPAHRVVLCISFFNKVQVLVILPKICKIIPVNTSNGLLGSKLHTTLSDDLRPRYINCQSAHVPSRVQTMVDQASCAGSLHEAQRTSCGIRDETSDASIQRDDSKIDRPGEVQKCWCHSG